jgi:hypothetical protein
MAFERGKLEPVRLADIDGVRNRRLGSHDVRIPL